MSPVEPEFYRTLCDACRESVTDGPNRFRIGLVAPLTDTERLCCQVADLQDQLRARDERIAELEEELERANHPFLGPNRKTRLERGWQPAGKFTD